MFPGKQQRLEFAGLWIAIFTLNCFFKKIIIIIETTEVRQKFYLGLLQ